jgi:AcrR family transcriptional regulator
MPGDRGSVRAAEIVEAAAGLFAQKGFDGVSVRDICSALALNCSIVSY